MTFGQVEDPREELSRFERQLQLTVENLDRMIAQALSIAFSVPHDWERCFERYLDEYASRHVIALRHSLA